MYLVYSNGHFRIFGYCETEEEAKRISKIINDAVGNQYHTVYREIPNVRYLIYVDPMDVRDRLPRDVNGKTIPPY